VFNVGSNEQNYQISEVGEIIAGCFPDAEIDWQHEKEDERSYQVDFSKIERVLDYEVEETIAGAAEEIKARLEAGEFGDYTDDRYSNYRTIEQESD
jgi:nucleoside-diphosphate-sugar epimerase